MDAVRFDDESDQFDVLYVAFRVATGDAEMKQPAITLKRPLNRALTDFLCIAVIELMRKLVAER